MHDNADPPLTDPMAPDATPSCGSSGTVRCLLLAWMAAGVASCGGGGSHGSSAATPTTAVRAEAVVLSGEQTSRLRQPATTIKAVYGYNEAGHRVDYQQGTDWLASGQGLARTANSRLPDFAGYGYTASSGGSFSFSADPRNPPLTIPSQVYVDYSSSTPDRLVQPAAGAARHSRVVCLGDSIAAGAHTIANYFLGTDVDTYCGLLRNHLGATAEVLNPSVPGGTLASVLPTLPVLLAARPQTVVLAFGMNDHVAGSAALPDFEATLLGTVQQAQAAGARVILVGFIQQNTRWVREDPAQTLAYNQAINRVANQRGVAFIDIRTVFDRTAPDGNPIESRTGDFMHHPNSFGHRVYFSLLLPHFLAAPALASTLPGFVDLTD